jgi:uncharacterized protein (DUF302 family)
MKTVSQLILFLLLTTFTVSAQEGVVKINSNHSFEETVKLLRQHIDDKGMTLFTTVDHKANAEKAGMKMLPTTLLIFGNPKTGTPLMQCNQTYGLDLPQKILVYQTDNNQVWVLYNDQSYLANRHHLQNCDQEIDKVSQALSSLIREALKQ